MSIGKNIREHRKLQGLTQKALADKSGVAEITIRQYENEKRTPNSEILIRIADALKITLYELIGGKNLSNYLNQIECDLQQATNFFDYLSYLGYFIVEMNQGNESLLYLKNKDNAIRLNPKDLDLLKNLEDTTNQTIKRTLDLLIATKTNS